MGRFASAARVLFGYDAAKNSTRRKARTTVIKSEDDVLDERGRLILSSGTADLQRNYAIASWAIRKHLDYVSSFTFQARTDNPELDREIERLMRNYGNRKNCDAANRHRLNKIIRISEAMRTINGDHFLIKMSSGRVQMIEGDRIKTAKKNLPLNFNTDGWVHGVKVGKAMQALQYMVCDRDKYGGTVYRTTVPAKYMIPLGYYDRADQVRGVSPLAAAINDFADLYESKAYIKSKIKVAAMFGLSIYSSATTGLEDDPIEGEDETEDERYNLNPGDGPFKLELDQGDRAEFLESKTPATETQAFLSTVIMTALKALDIPYTFYDEREGNYSKDKGALNQYIKACKTKREDLIEALDDLTAWRLGLFIEDGQLRLPGSMTLSDVRWEWVPDGVRWWNPLQEATGNVVAISSLQDNPERVCRENGTDVYENIAAISRVMKAAKASDVPYGYATTTTQILDNPVVQAAVNQSIAEDAA